MFTGIIIRKGFIKTKSVEGGQVHLSVETDPFEQKIALGDSMAVSGVCLTVTAWNQNEFHFDILKETCVRTTLSERGPGDQVNLEPALRYGDPLGGHIVNGHVDEKGKVLSFQQLDGGDRVLEVGVSPALREHLVEKGSITVDGVSLTVVEVREELFSVHIIPHTYQSTAFSQLKPGDEVNLEADILSKYVKRHLAKGRTPGPLTWEQLES